jgi:hypothetical protein
MEQQLDMFDLLIDESTTHQEVTKAPTFEVHFYDRHMKQRAAWYRGKNENDVTNSLMAEYGRNVDVINIKKSDRELEVIEALN